jgi:hypothetical protein
LVASFAIISWLTLSNHCAIGAIGAIGAIATATAAEPDEQQCPMHPAPAKQKDSAVQNCCKVVRALAPKPAKLVIASLTHLPPWLQHVEVDQPVRFPAASVSMIVTGNGPPAGLCFAESVLQRSLLAHAPPVAG